ncbi:MAG: DUF3570 domain-containing protein [Enterobacterales bacterium]|nr:DUF3570 domain-containing protein [Enterobacterales bacterium]
MAVTSRRLLLLLALAFSSVKAATLPDDQADLLYHAYEGGGVEITGPSLLVRKKILDNFSVTANYYVDMVTSASIDVVTTASQYTEERTQTSLGLTYLNDKTTLSVNFTNSTENDYEADTAYFSISQDFFSNLTTVALSYTLGDDTVMQNGDEDFMEELARQSYRFDVSQVITKNSILALAVESITDEGYLNNPYRQVRFLDPNEDIGYRYQREVYPNTRTSTAVALTGKYFLPYRAVVFGEYRAYTDSWGIDAANFELGYVHPFEYDITLEVSYRTYEQDQADFYSDLFPFQNAQNFLARDKELSDFTSDALTIGVTYDFKMNSVFDRGSVNLFYNFMTFDYENFRDLTVSATPGEEPLYSLDATVIRAFVSFWF